MALSTFKVSIFLLWGAVIVEGLFMDRPRNYPFFNTSRSWQERVDDLVSRLTLEEIQDQLSHGGAGASAPAIERLNIDRFRWDNECLRGAVRPNTGFSTSYPQSIGLGAAFSGDLIYRVAEATGVEVRAKHNDRRKAGDFGTHSGAACFSPVINIMRDPRWGRNQETYGEDPYLSGIYAANFIKGLQGNHSRYVRASGGCKHFDVHGGPEGWPSQSRLGFDTKVSELDWRTTFLPAFKRCIEAGSYSIMCSYNRINGVPACANKKLLTDILRTEWGFDGYVVSDEGAIENIVNYHHYLNNAVDVVAACINAGCNLELSHWGEKNIMYTKMVEAVHQGKLTEAKVREMVKPLFYTRMRLGDFDDPKYNPYSELYSDGHKDVGTPAHKALALEAAMKSFVLLKNKGVLPFKRHSFNSIGLIGPMSNNRDEIMGDYPPLSDPADMKTPFDALNQISQHVKKAEGCDDMHCNSYSTDKINWALSGNDVNIVAIGTGPSNEQEGHDRHTLELPGKQKQLLQDVINHTPSNTPIVVLMFNGGPANISFADQDDRVGAILACFYPAQATGDAIRHVLLNDVKGAVPAGRMPYTWPMLASQVPDMEDYTMNGRTYRYYHGDPLYPFGYGLSYTTFEYSEVYVSGSINAGEPLTGSARIKNTGQYDADEVVQVYIRWQDHSLPVPKIQLVWFDRVTVPRGGNGIQVHFEVEARSMAHWENDGWHIKSGWMDIFVGGEQPNQAKNRGHGAVTQRTFEIKGSKFLGKY